MAFRVDFLFLRQDPVYSSISYVIWTRNIPHLMSWKPSQLLGKERLRMVLNCVRFYIVLI